MSAYINSLGGEFNGLYNKTGRGYPDISAQGYHFLTVWNGTIVPLDGTSAATPTAAAVISLVNDALIAAGRPPLGFFNPFLYASAYQAFTDVTAGSAIGCGTTGFPAMAGWDAVSGFGSPVSPHNLSSESLADLKFLIVFPHLEVNGISRRPVASSTDKSPLCVYVIDEDIIARMSGAIMPLPMPYLCTYQKALAHSGNSDPCSEYNFKFPNISS